MNSKWILLGGIGMIAVGAGVYFFIVRRKKTELDKYGNIKLQNSRKRNAGTVTISGGVQASKGEQSSAVIEPDWENPFDLNYANDVKTWVKPKTLLLLKDQFAKQYANEIYDAKGITDDDEEAIRNVFSKKTKDKVHVSNVASAFWKTYGKDLLEFLKGTLSDAEMETYVYEPIRNLPNYRLA